MVCFTGIDLEGNIVESNELNFMRFWEVKRVLTETAFNRMMFANSYLVYNKDFKVSDVIRFSRLSKGKSYAIVLDFSLDNGIKCKFNISLDDMETSEIVSKYKEVRRKNVLTLIDELLYNNKEGMNEFYNNHGFYKMGMDIVTFGMNRHNIFSKISISMSEVKRTFIGCRLVQIDKNDRG